MVLNAAVQMLREADDLKVAISKFKNGTSMLQEHSLWATQQKLQKIYQKVLVLDLDYALDKKVEQDLWNIGFKQQIEALQSISKDRKNPLRSKGQAMLSWVLQAAAGFYLCLLHQICTTLQLDLPFRRRASLLGWVEGWGAGSCVARTSLPAPDAARYICQHCLVHLGDLARYQHQLRVAHTFYRHALVVSVDSGQPYNQLALVSWRRARSLAALYWHVRSLLVRAPFPPAPANLARTLRAAAHPPLTDRGALPVLPGVTPSPRDASTLASVPADVTHRLDAHSYVTELIRALHYIHTGDELDKAEALVKSLNSSLTTLIATESFESSMLIKMTVVLIWLVHSSTEELTLLEQEATGSEQRQASLALRLAGGALLGLLLPACSAPQPCPAVLPALKVWLEWSVAHAGVLCSEAWCAHAALWLALAHTLSYLAQHAECGDKYATVPLPEDEELHGFLPLEGYLKHLQFPNHAAWDTYGARVPPSPRLQDAQSSLQMSTCLIEEPELQRRVRAHRLVQLGKKLADMRPEHFSYTEVDDVVTFSAVGALEEQLGAALEELAAARCDRGHDAAPCPSDTDDDDSDCDAPTLKPPIVISEADFRERVREKRAGILKPQGSLERAREERAMLTQDDQSGAVTFDEQDEGSEDSSKCDDRREARKPRINIAMAAIMRKQEENNKQVTFVTPPPVSEPVVDITQKIDKPKVIQPKAIKSLANLPIGRKTGGILSLKDKSGYPHLVNTESEKKEKEEKKEQKASDPPQPQPYQAKRQELPPSPTWPANNPPAVNGPRMTLQKNYGIQNAGANFNPTPTSYGPRSPTYHPAAAIHNQGIRLPVVNPKEIDVRTAALQKQNSRQDMFQEGHKFHNYQVSGDKKNFLNDLPPRFANQYRYWQAAQENQLGDNKFRDDSPKTAGNAFNQPPRSSWSNQPQPENYQPAPWWQPDTPPPNFNYEGPMKPNYFTPQMNNNVPNPYQNMPTYNQMLNNMGRKPDNASQYINLPSTIGQPMQTLRSVVTSPNFNSSLNSFSSYPPAVTYDAAMYPQFNNLGYRPLQAQNSPTFQNKDLMDLGVGFGNNAEHAQRMGFHDLNNGMDGENMLEHNKVTEGSGGEAPANTYSLFSGAPHAASWGSAQNHMPQSLWSGPGPSPLQRLLEQQKQLSQAAAPLPPPPPAPPQ